MSCVDGTQTYLVYTHDSIGQGEDGHASALFESIGYLRMTQKHDSFGVHVDAAELQWLGKQRRASWRSTVIDLLSPKVYAAQARERTVSKCRQGCLWVSFRIALVRQIFILIGDRSEIGLSDGVCWSI